jgi:hypothetical protein
VFGRVKGEGEKGTKEQDATKRRKSKTCRAVDRMGWLDSKFQTCG